MPLRSIELERYRAIVHGRLVFGPTTVVFGENDHGRTSLIEALRLVLGAPGEAFEDGLRPYHFHRSADGAVGPLHVRLRVAEAAPGAWRLPPALEAAFPAGDVPRELDLDFRATLDPATGAIATGHRVSDPTRPGALVPGDPATAAWVRRQYPVLWMGAGRLAGMTGPGAEPDPFPPTDLTVAPAIRTLARHHRNILAGDVPDMEAELDAGARAAEAVLAQHRDIFPATGPGMSAIVAEILRRPAAPSSVDAPPATPAAKIAVLLLTGTILQLAAHVARSGPVADGAEPVLVIENPEANLHPMTLASVWRILEQVAWQRVVATHADAILATAPLTSLRRLSRRDGRLRAWSVNPRSMSAEDLRKVSYHLRSRRAAAMFARCWVLVEGETEYWVIPELARVLGYDLAVEGVACVEFAQCGLPPLLALAAQLGIETHVLVDGDEAGQHYEEAAAAVAAIRGGGPRPVTRLAEPDIEHAFWAAGFADVIAAIARVQPGDRDPPGHVIHRAIERTSKPFLALSLIDAAAGRGPASVPPVLRGVIESAVALARGQAVRRG